MNDFFVEMKIKENKHKYTPIVDSFKGTADDARDLLSLKYCSRRSRLFDFRKFWTVASKEIEEFCEELEVKFGYKTNKTITEKDDEKRID